MHNPDTAPTPPDFIEKRFRRAPSPACTDRIVSKSIPIVAFGNPTVARIATIGINPSSKEFAIGVKLRTGESARLKCLDDLNVDALNVAPPEVIAEAYRSCCDYFKGPHYYKEWFDMLSPILQAAGASYVDGSACHLDLVQWATKSKWGDVPAEVRQELLKEDVPFLCQLLRNYEYEMLLLNGKSVMDTVAAQLSVAWCCKEPFHFRGRRSTLKFGWYAERTKVIGWSFNPQSHRQGLPVESSELQPIIEFVATCGTCTEAPRHATPNFG